MYSVIQQPADSARADGYGEIANIPGKMFETFMGIFQADNAPNPHDVATTIFKLIDTPKGKRPDRVVVGQPFGVDAVNAQTSLIQRQVVEVLGLGALAEAPASSVG
jgi:hypothetical protein